jgi:hypothetical protein
MLIVPAWSEEPKAGDLNLGSASSPSVSTPEVLSRAVLQAIFIFFRAFIIGFKTMNLLESYNRRIVFQKKKKKSKLNSLKPG